MVAAATRLEALRALVANVRDPEIPILTVEDLGILRDVALDGDAVTVTITPTYSGCPAMRAIEDEIRGVLEREGVADVRVETRLAPAWTTDWLSEAGRAKLREVGIAPPAEPSANKRALRGEAGAIACPQCGSTDTTLVSEFGSTACKALHRCRACLEPFDYFKCL